MTLEQREQIDHAVAACAMDIIAKAHEDESLSFAKKRIKQMLDEILKAGGK